MYGQDRANGLLSLHELKTICKEYNCPDWFFNAVEATKVANWPSK
jgi:hypothetical protein